MAHSYVGMKKATLDLVRKITKSAELRGFTDVIMSIASNRAGDILAISEGNFMSQKRAVYIYCKQSNGQYKKQSSLNVAGPKFDGSQFCYVATTADEKYLVANGRYMHMYSQSGQYQHVCYKNNAPGANLRCINTMKDGRIIAGDYGRQYGQSVITLHTPDGMTLIKTINTSIQPESITAINNTHVAICTNYNNKVCVIDLESGEETLRIEIDRPQSVCYDEECNYLLIAHGGRLGQSVIDQYSLSTGVKIAAACIAQNLYLPSCMIFTGDGMLAVKDNHTVKLYTVGLEG